MQRILFATRYVVCPQMWLLSRLEFSCHFSGSKIKFSWKHNESIPYSARKYSFLVELKIDCLWRGENQNRNRLFQRKFSSGWKRCVRFRRPAKIKKKKISPASLWNFGSAWSDFPVFLGPSSKIWPKKRKTEARVDIALLQETLCKFNKTKSLNHPWTRVLH